MERGLDATEQLKWTLIGDQEHNNLRAALDWGLQEGAMLEDALRVAASISLYWIARSHFLEGLEWLRMYLSRGVEPVHQPSRVKLLYRSGAMAGYMFDHLTGRKLCEQAIELARALGQKRDLAGALYYFSEIAGQMGQKSEARTALEESISLCWQEQYHNQLSISLASMGVLLDQAGDFDGAQSTLEEALAIAQRSNDWWGVGHALQSLGAINRFKRRYDASIDYFVRSLEVTLKIGDRHA